MSFAYIPDVSTTMSQYTLVAFTKFILTDRTLTCSVKKWNLVTNYPNILKVKDTSHISENPIVMGKLSYKAKACADTACTIFVESNLVTITKHCNGSSTFPAINIIHPISDNV
jgi:hypothetical protein